MSKGEGHQQPLQHTGLTVSVDTKVPFHPYLKLLSQVVRCAPLLYRGRMEKFVRRKSIVNKLWVECLFSCASMHPIRDLEPPKVLHYRAT